MNAPSKTLAMAVILLMSSSAMAEKSPFSYNFIQAGYGSGTLKSGGLSFDLTGTEFDGSFSTSDTTFLLGSYTNGTAKLGGASVNIDRWSIGFGGRMPISGTTDLTLSASYRKDQVEGPGGWAWATGTGLEAGVRHLISERVELGGSLGVTIMGSDRDVSSLVGVDVKFKVAKDFSLGVMYSSETGDGSTMGLVGIAGRIEF